MSETVLDAAVRKVEELISSDEAKDLKRMTEYTLADAIREGSSVTGQAYAWSDANGNLCALSAAVAAATARGYM